MYDFSNNSALSLVRIQNNLLDQLNTKNGNWQNLDIKAQNNNLTCVEVDNIGYANNNNCHLILIVSVFNTETVIIPMRVTPLQQYKNKL